MSVLLSGDYMVTLQQLNLLCSDTTTALLHEFVWPRVKSLRVKYIFPGRSKVDFVQSLLLLPDYHIRLLMVRTVGFFFWFFLHRAASQQGIQQKTGSRLPLRGPKLLLRGCLWSSFDFFLGLDFRCLCFFISALIARFKSHILQPRVTTINLCLVNTLSQL